MEEFVEKDKVKQVEVELSRMSDAIKMLKRMQPTEATFYDSGQYTAAVRRASMDLTRALARLRNS